MKTNLKLNVRLAVAALTCLWALTVSLEAQNATPARAVTVQAMPPAVVKTVPAAGDTAVDPALNEITVTFSKDMITDRMWSVCQISNDTYPQKAGEVHYLADKRTFVMPVKLEPGKTYALWFNRGQFNAFRDQSNNPSVPYLLVFQTKP